MSKEYKKIIAIIVTYNGKKWYDRCFGSMLNSSVPVDVVVVDNASNDDTVGYIKTNYPAVHVISSQENYGFAKANNIGMKYALAQEADYVFLLNQDAWVEQDTIEKLLQTFQDNDNVGIASPVHLNGSYTGLDSGFCNYVGAACISDMYLGKLKPYYSVPMVNAAAWLISRDCIEKVGGFDTSLFKHYGEDDHYAQRVLFHGMKVVINTQCTACHDREQRTDQPIDSPFNAGNPYYYYIHQKSNVLVEYNLEQQIRSKRIALLKSYIMLSLTKAKRLKTEIALDQKIAHSRMINTSVGGGLCGLKSVSYKRVI